MGRRRYKRPRAPAPKDCLHDPHATASHPQGSRQTRAKVSTVGFTHELRSYLEQWESSDRVRNEKRARRLRVFLQQVVSVNAAFVCAEVFMGYFVVLEDKESNTVVKQDSLKAGVCLISLIQVLMVVCYWKAYFGYREAVQEALQPGSLLHKALKRSPLMVCICAAEAVFYLITLYPGLQLRIYFPGSVVDQSADSLAYVCILFRSYQAVRLLYWLCPFSDMRTHIFARVTTVQHSSGFVMRCLVARYGFVLVAIVCGLVVLILGLIEFVFERYNTALYMDVIWNDQWLSAFTVTTIGYGNIHPNTFSGQLAMMTCALFGNLILGFLTTVNNNSLSLSLSECNMYSHLLYTRQKGKFPTEAVLTLQLWWRLMRMRMSKKLHGPTIIRFYSQLRAYRSTLVACQRDKDTLFSRQITAFDNSTHRQFHTLNEYLQPINGAYPLLQDIYRNEYRIKSLCRTLLKLARKQKVSSSGAHTERTHTPPHSDSDTLTFSSVVAHRKHFGKKAKAKLNAYQNVVNRLVKEEAWAGPSHEVVRGDSGSISRLRLSKPL